jgi:hypothetical protein
MPLLLGIACILFMFAEIHNGRFHYSDFEVYYQAGHRILAGENLYRPVEDGFYRYLYSPTAALYFIPISFLTFPVAKVVYWCFLTAMILAGLYLAFSLISPDIRNESPARINTLFLLAGLILGVHIQRELHLGQVNHILLVFYLAIVYCYARGKTVLLAVLWAMSVFIKPFAFIFLPYFVLKRRWKEMALCCIFTLLLFAAPLLFYTPDEYSKQLQGEMTEIKIELQEKQDLLHSANHTIFSVLARYSPLNMITFTPSVTKTYQGAVLCLMAGFIFWFVRCGESVERGYIPDFALLIACIPLLSYTSYNAFGFVELLVCLLLYHFSSLTRSERFCVIAGFVLSGGNWYDLWRKRLWRVFEGWSLLSIGTILLIAVLMMKRHARKL